ncbi:MAG: carboxypeptidase-like regulatory domain-containing protein [Acidobacteriaceae bacterium]
MMKMTPCMWMKKTSSLTPRPNRFLSLTLLACLAAGPALCAGALLLSTPASALAQKNVPRERILTGKVVNKDGDPIGGAVVYLKDSHTNSVKTYIADSDGSFRFGELSQDTDYEVWAESNGVRSKSRDISSFDNESSFYFVFKLNVVKPVSLDGPTITDTGLNPQP